MVSGTVLALAVVLGIAGPGESAAPSPGADTPDVVRDGLTKGKYPWYDSKNDSAKPVVIDFDFDWNFNLRGFGLLGAIFGRVLAAIALGIACYLIALLWRRYRFTADAGVRIVTDGMGTARRVEDLPAGLRPETDDPWAEAVRLRERGDYAGATVRLFAHQLLTLDRLKQIRLVPGRTGRQLVRAVDDPKFHSWVEPTLRLFELVYYGQVTPSPDAFEAVWASALDFQKHVATRAGS